MATASTEVPPRAALEITSEEQQTLLPEVKAFGATVRDPLAQERYRHLAQAVEQGLVPDDLVGSLEVMLELVLQTQRIRRTHGAEAEKQLLDLFGRTPRGAAQRKAAREVNQGRPPDDLLLKPRQPDRQVDLDLRDGVAQRKQERPLNQVFDVGEQRTKRRAVKRLEEGQGAVHVGADHGIDICREARFTSHRNGDSSDHREGKVLPL